MHTDICHDFSSDCCDNEPDKMIFNPFQLNESRFLVNDPDLDPDENFYCHNDDITSQYVCDYNTECFINSNDFCVAHINCRSILNKMSAVVDFAHKFCVDVLAVTETWLNVNSAEAVSIPGYKFVNKCRNTSSGGGVGLFVKEHYEFKLMELTGSDEDNTEFIFIEIVHENNKNVIVGSIYRPPGNSLASFNDTLFKILSNLNKHKHIYIAGDFNLDLLKSNLHPATEMVLNTFMTYQMLPTIRKPTRVTSYSATLIDNIYTNCSSLCTNSMIICTDISDHMPVLITCRTGKVKSPECKPVPVRVINESNMRLFNEALENTDWSKVIHYCHLNSPDLAYKEFINDFNLLYDYCFPVKTLRVSRKSPKHPWMTKLLIKSCNKKSRLYKKMIKNPSDKNTQVFTQYRNKLKSLLRSAERSYYNDKFMQCKQDLKSTWKLVRTLLNQPDKKQIPNVFIKDGTNIEGHSNIANEFNTYFTNISSTLLAKIPASNKDFHHYLKSAPPDSLFFHPCTPAEIINTCNELQQKQSVGYDNISSSVIKNSISNLAYILAELVNCSMSNGIVPDELKIAKVVPIYKTGDTNVFSNYRPISVLPFFSKIFEKIAANRLTDYLDKYNIINKNQFGFRKNCSTSMAVINMVEKITKALDEKLFTIGVFIDLSKAFDTVNHQILLSKLTHYGIRGVTLNWFSSYLHNRYQYVAIKDAISSKQQVMCGVPQGSILGPLLFLIYINDIASSSSLLQFVLFADDTNLFYCNKSIEVLEETVNKELDLLSTWFRANKLSLNVDKTNFILFKSRNKQYPEISVYIDGRSIKQVSQVKFLGVYLDELLNWSSHISNISTKTAKNSGILSKLKYKLPSSVLLMLYNTMILPYLTYCNIVWACNSNSQLAHLIKLQKRAVRIVYKTTYREHTSPVFKMLNILKLQDINKFQIAVFMYKYHHNLLPLIFDDFFCLNADIHTYYTRHSNALHMPAVRTTLRQRSIVFVGPLIWNQININFYSLPSVASFKFHYKRLLMSAY